MPSSTITARPTLAADGRRHSTRSIRSNVVRPTNYYARPVGYRGAGNNQAGGKSATNDAPGFCPAIEHFTDGLAALPKEVMRHLTLLKETEGKAYQFDEQIRDTLTTIEALPDPPRHSSTNYSHPFFLGLSLANSVNGSAHGSIADGATPALRSSQFELADDANAATSETMTDEQTELRHRHFHQLQSRLSELLVVLDEKNMVLSTANDTLDRQLARLDGTMPYVEQEISEEARLGSNTHWALAHMKDSRRANGTSNVGSARRDAQGTNSLVAAAAAVHEVDVAAARSEARREVMLARSKNKHVESDFDERPVARKVSGISKSRKAAEPAAHEVSKDSNTATVASTSNKRRRIDKTVPAMEKSMSQALAGKLAAPSSATREGPAVDNKKKAIKQPLPAPIARKRAQPESPRLASSPTRGTFATTTNKESSASGSRNGQPRRQNSIQSARSGVPENQKARPSSSTSQPKAVNGASTSDLAHVADVTGRSIGEVRANLKDNYVTEDGDRAVETDGLQGALVVKAAESVVANTLKREETEPMEQDGEAKGISSVPMASTRSRQGSKISKASLPTASPFGEVGSALHGGAGMSRSRSTRNAASNHASPAFGPVDLSSRRAGGSSHSKKSSISGMASHHNNGSNAAGTTTTTSTTSPTRKSARKSPFDALSPTSTPNDIPTMSLTNSTNHTANSRFTANHDSAGIHGSGGGRPPSRPASSRKNTIDPLGPSSPTAAPDGTDRDPDETASMPADSPEVPRSSTRRSGGGATTTSDALTSTSTSAIIPATTSSFPTSKKSTPTATSSKAGASAAVSAAVPTEPDDEEVELDADVDGPPSSPDSNEPRYCVCGQVSYGDMIACDNDSCPREWFHLACVGLTKAPAGKAKWFCEECKEGMARARGEHGNASGGGNGKEGGGGGGGGGAGAGAGAGGKERRR